MVAGEIVKIIVVDTDRYGRLVGKIYQGNGTYVNLAMVAQGYAWWYEKYAKSELKFRTAQNDAKTAKLGLWAEADAMPPWAWRRGQRKNED